MALSFDIAINRLRLHEGGFSITPKDPGNWTGGKVGVGVLRGTKYGIAANTYPHLDIRNLTWETAKAIYHRDFWLACHADELPGSVTFAVFDGAVNSGVARSLRWLQAAAGLTGKAVDGIWGNDTRDAVLCADPDALAYRHLAYRLRFMKGLPNWPDASRGWADRIAANLIYAAGDR